MIHQHRWQRLLKGDPGDVPRDPIITPILIGAGLIPGGIFAGSATIFGISAATILTGAALVGANYALNAINKPKSNVGGVGSASSVNTPEARGNVQQSAPVQQWVYGRVRKGGAVFIVDDSKPPYLDLGLLLSGRQISGIRGVQISTNNIVPASFAFNTILNPLAVDGQTYIKSGASRLQMSFGAGLPTQAIDPILAADFPNLDASFRQRGIARAVFRFKFGDDAADFEKMWGQGVSIPSPLIDVDGMPLYDSRDPSQFYPSDWRDDAEVAEAMATWKYSRDGKDVGRTAALAQADWLGHPDGVNYPPGRIRWDEIARSAEFDEDRGHYIDGVVSLDQSPRTNLEAMLTANRGFCVQDRGYGWIGSSQPRDPVITIDDDLLMGGFEFQCDRAKADLVNTVRSRFSSDDREYQDVDGPVLEEDDLIEADGETLAKTVRLPFTSDADAVQYLANQYLDEARLPRSLTCTVKIKATGDDVGAGKIARVYSNIYPQMNGDYSIESIGFLDDFSGLTLSLKEYDREISVRSYPLKPFTLPALNVS